MERRVVDGVELAYRTTGAHGRPVILLHGLTSISREWSLTTRALTNAGRRVLSPDLPGHGESSAPNDPMAYRMERMADLVHALANQLGFSPSVVVGNSMGGAIAQEYAIRHPEAVSGLVLVDSVGDVEESPERSPAHEDFARREFSAALEKGMEAVWELHQQERGWLFAGGLTPQRLSWRKARFCATSAEGYLYSNRALDERRPTLDDLAGLSCKTLVVCCEHEAPDLKRVSDRLASTIPGAEYETIPRAWHSPQLENAAEFNKTLLAFLARF